MSKEEIRRFFDGFPTVYEADRKVHEYSTKLLSDLDEKEKKLEQEKEKFNRADQALTVRTVEKDQAWEKVRELRERVEKAEREATKWCEQSKMEQQDRAELRKRVELAEGKVKGLEDRISKGASCCDLICHTEKKTLESRLNNLIKAVENVKEEFSESYLDSFNPLSLCRINVLKELYKALEEAKGFI